MNQSHMKMSRNVKPRPRISTQHRNVGFDRFYWYHITSETAWVSATQQQFQQHLK